MPTITANAVGTSEEHDEAQTDTWVHTDGDVTFTTVTRFAYNDDGDQKLYAFYRDLSYDSEGHLLNISPETRVTIDEPGACGG